MIMTESKKLCDVLADINDNRLVMPAFQRNYEWDLDRIERLWDSILQGYPFSTFLFWELDAEHVTRKNFFYVFARECNFKKNGDNRGCEYHRDVIDFDLPNHPTIAVLDGQQRLTSLFLSLYGVVWKEPRKNSSKSLLRLFIELDKSKIDEGNELNSKKFGIRFSDRAPSLPSPSLFEVKRLLSEEFKSPDTREIAIEDIVAGIPNRQKDYATKVLNKLCKAFYDDELVTYTKISGLGQDDALEMFVRFNSGGKPLTKAQISMSILEVYWPNVKKDFERALSGAYSDFGTDFILRTAHMIFGDVVKSNIDEDFTVSFRSGFQSFLGALEHTSDLFTMAHYDLTKFVSKWNTIIPIIYLVFNNPDYIESADGIFAYLFRSILFNFYSSGTTGKLQKMKSLLFESGFQLTIPMLDSDEDLRQTEARIDDILFAEKGSPLVANVLYCLGLNSSQNDCDCDIDHIHPESRFRASKPLGMSDEDWATARRQYNKLPNLQLLEAGENKTKGDQDFDMYYLGLSPESKRRMKTEGYIPDPGDGRDQRDYYNISNFLQFYQDRKDLLSRKINGLLNGVW